MITIGCKLRKPIGTKADTGTNTFGQPLPEREIVGSTVACPQVLRHNAVVQVDKVETEHVHHLQTWDDSLGWSGFVDSLATPHTRLRDTEHKPIPLSPWIVTILTSCKAGS